MITLSNGVQLAASDPNVATAGSAASWLYGWVPALSPNITVQPANQNVAGGRQISLAVTATGIPNPAYQWQSNGTNIVGATNAAYAVADANVSSSGAYSVIVSNASGVVVSSNAIVVVSNSPPAIAPFANQTVNAGMYVSITNLAIDPDAPPQILTFSLPIGPTNATVNATNGIFNWRPSASQGGTTNPVSVEVTDNGSPNLSATNLFSVFVNPVSRPALGSIDYQGSELSITVSNGTIGPDYWVQVSTNLLDWQTLLVSNSPPQPFTFTDPGPLSLDARFYRVLLFP